MDGLKANFIYYMLNYRYYIVQDNFVYIAVNNFALIGMVGQHNDL